MDRGDGWTTLMGAWDETEDVSLGIVSRSGEKG